MDVKTMADYIKREDAISYIKDHQCSSCSDIGLCGKCAVLIALKLLEKVPAADVRENGYADGQRDRWISVDDALPKNDERVLVCGVRNGINICRYWENSGYGGHLEYMFFSNKQKPITVTHWMPLPEPPEVKE